MKFKLEVYGSIIKLRIAVTKQFLRSKTAKMRFCDAKLTEVSENLLYYSKKPLGKSNCCPFILVKITDIKSDISMAAIKNITDTEIPICLLTVCLL